MTKSSRSNKALMAVLTIIVGLTAFCSGCGKAKNPPPKDGISSEQAEEYYK